jgi:hypothetical protein
VVHYYRVSDGVFEVFVAHGKLDGCAVVFIIFIVKKYLFGPLLKVVHLGAAEVELFPLLTIFVLLVLLELGGEVGALARQDL